MHAKYGDETLTDFSGAYSPDASYVAPTIAVPQTMEDDNDGITWDADPAC